MSRLLSSRAERTHLPAAACVLVTGQSHLVLSAAEQRREES
jgi:hypothetical protein